MWHKKFVWLIWRDVELHSHMCMNGILYLYIHTNIHIYKYILYTYVLFISFMNVRTNDLIPFDKMFLIIAHTIFQDIYIYIHTTSNIQCYLSHSKQTFNVINREKWWAGNCARHSCLHHTNMAQTADQNSNKKYINNWEYKKGNNNHISHRTNMRVGDCEHKSCTVDRGGVWRLWVW